MIRSFWHFRRFLRRYTGLLAIGGSLAVIDIALGLAQPWPMKVVVDDVLRARGATRHSVLFLPDTMTPKALLTVSIGLLVVIALGAAAADYWSTRMMESAGQRMGNDVREDLFNHLQRLSLRYHGQHRVGDLAARLTGDVDRVQDMLVQAFSVLVPNALLLIGMVTVMLAVDPQFTALALLTAPFMVFAIARSTRQMKQASRRARKADGVVAALATEHLSAIQVVQAFSLEGRSAEEFGRLNQDSLRASLDAVRHQARLGPSVDISAALATAVLLWFGANRVLSGRMTLGVLLVFVAYVGSLYKPIKALSKLGYVISRGSVCAERIEGIFAEVPDVEDAPIARPAGRLRGAISFEQVTFSYGRESVLEDVSLDIDPGEVVAVVGATGAGKSTLMSLIPRFFDPTAGTVRVDDQDVRDYTVASLRSQIALVLQESVLFQGTLAENIACGRPGASDRDVRHAAALALVDEFTDRLPDGLDTVVGERGANLSGGQRQRIAIARAVLRDAPILLLDEPTSALDAGSEALVVEALHNLMVDRTTIVIAHRLSTVRRANRVVVFDAGRIVEHGTHEALLKSQGAYARLSALQGLEPPASTPAARSPMRRRRDAKLEPRPRARW